MNDVTAQTLKDWIDNSDEEAVYGELTELAYLSPGAVLIFDAAPTEFSITIAENKFERRYNSYGSRSDDGFVILEVSNTLGESKFFKLPMTYASFEGWHWHINSITEVSLQEKVVTTWEWM